ncbi:hypothetical protein HD806DRAFT_409321 [Xylariaceae sp. AK1471]|nr:hypothetical protein HD806DRAFT_409321 [Xylariaceae sp. AK1471]
MEPPPHVPDEPVRWDTDRVVQELCTAKGSWGLYKPGGLPARLEEQLREHEIDGHQLVHEIKNNRRQDLFFEAMRITKFAQKTFLLNCIEKLQATTEILETIPARKQSSAAGKRTQDAGEELSITGLESTQIAKKRRLPPEELLTTARDPSQGARQRVGYLRDSGFHSHEILHGADPNPATDDDVRGFSFCTEGLVHLGHQQQVNRLLRRKWLNRRGATVPASHRRSLPADMMMPSHDPFDDEVLPLYGDAEEDYDMEMWDEIEKEKQEDEQQAFLTRGLPTDTVNTVLDNVIRSWELQWREAKLPTLRYEAPAMWRQLHGGSWTSARRELSREQHRLEKRISEMRKGVVKAGPWYTERELSRRVANLRPSIHDLLKIGWALDLARQESEPEKAARPPARQRTGTDNAHDNDDTGPGEELESESDTDKPTTTQWQGSYRSRHIPSNYANGTPADKPGPAHSMEIIDLTREPDDLPEGQVSDALVNHDENMERAVWRFACTFTGHDFAKTDSANPRHYHRFQGLGLALKPHQLWAVTRLLFTYHFEKTFGVLLADGMGVGKTFESSCGIILTPYIRLAAQDVKLDRKCGHGRHLLPSTPICPQGSDSECPSGTYVRGFACPCVERLPTAQLLEFLPRGPAVILVPSGLREQWYQQLCKYISPASLLDSSRKPEIWSIHTAADKITSTMRSTYPRIKFLSASELRQDEITDDQ